MVYTKSRGSTGVNTTFDCNCGEFSTILWSLSIPLMLSGVTRRRKKVNNICKNLMPIFGITVTNAFKKSTNMPGVGLVIREIDFENKEF